MFDNFSNYFRGFTEEQYTRANISVLVNYLSSKNIIDSQDFYKYYENNIEDIIDKIVENDKKEYKEKYNKEVK